MVYFYFLPLGNGADVIRMVSFFFLLIGDFNRFSTFLCAFFVWFRGAIKKFLMRTNFQFTLVSKWEKYV